MSEAKSGKLILQEMEHLKRSTEGLLNDFVNLMERLEPVLLHPGAQGIVHDSLHEHKARPTPDAPIALEMSNRRENIEAFSRMIRTIIDRLAI